MDKMQEVNVQVAVRVRPLLPKEKMAGEQMCVRVICNSNQVVVGRDKAFTFDHIFSFKSTQEEVYESCVQPLVKSLFEGYNATVFAYGQTGSGKTFTIDGGADITCLTEEENGIVPRAVKHMFDIMKENSNVEYTVRVSYIEIYKEELCDLLATDAAPCKDLHVREDDKGNTVIIGAQEVHCENLDDVTMCLQSGSSVRHIGSTQMNEHSSRSHSIFTVIIDQKWTDEDVLASRRSHKLSESNNIFEDDICHCMSAKFHFVDLAGSERAQRTGNAGNRLKESIHINTGLLALGNVISSLGDPKKKAVHIPYRDSKITRLLKDSLGGNAQTLMICCISPAASNFDESLNALKYANRAKNIKNKPIINRDIQSIRFEEMQSEIKALREELTRQRMSLVNAAGGDVNWEKIMQDANHIKALEDQVIRLNTECAHYRAIAEEAYKQLVEIQQRNILSMSQNVRVKDWLDLMEEIKNKVPSTLNKEEWNNETIKDLQAELKKCQQHLKSDEDIFAEKTKEVNQLKEQIKELESVLDRSSQCFMEVEEKSKCQQEQLIEQQIRIGELQKMLGAHNVRLTHATNSLDVDVGKSLPGLRPSSVPAHFAGCSDTMHLRPPSRHIRTSPALFSLDRVMQNFRARSQLLVNHLEEGDNVLHQNFNDDTFSHSTMDENKNEEESRLIRRGTFRIKKRLRGDQGNNLLDMFTGTTSGADAFQSLNLDYSSQHVDRAPFNHVNHLSHSVSGSPELGKEKMREAQMRMMESNQKRRDLAINIRLKQQLIRQLVATGKDAELMNKEYAGKIRDLEKERERIKRDLAEMQRNLHELEFKGHQEEVEKIRLRQQYKKRIEDAQTKMSFLQKKQKETEKFANFAAQNEKRIEELRLAVLRMKQQHGNLCKRLKEESDQKAKLEREMQKEQQRVKDLEHRNEQQQKILKRKTEEIARVQRKLRGTSLPLINTEEQNKVSEQKQWLDMEVEKVLEQRQQMEVLELELKKREEIITKKEAMLDEKSELEIKKLRSSQVLSKNLLAVSVKLESVEKKLEEKRQETKEVPDERHEKQEEMQDLRQHKEKLQQQKASLDDKLQGGILLSAHEERRLIELDEAVEALDAAIEYKTDIINSCRIDLRHSQITSQSNDNLMNRFHALSAADMRTLLGKYFEKVVSLRDSERKSSVYCDTLQIKIEEQKKLIRDTKNALERSAVDVDRKLTQQQQMYEHKIQLLMHQLAETTQGRVGPGQDTEVRISQLEKELYYYKKTSRDLKKHLRGSSSSSIQSQQDDNGNLSDRSSGKPDRNLGKEQDQDHGCQVVAIHTNDDSGNLHHSSGKGALDHVVGSLTPMKISRRDVREMSKAEVSLRLSAQHKSSCLQDSLED